MMSNKNCIKMNKGYPLAIFADIMSWSWKGFWGDDPVYRFNCGPDFFHAGRSKVLERQKER